MADSVASTAASSTYMDSKPKPKQVRHDQARRAETERNKQKKIREAKCEAAGVPYTEHMKLASAVKEREQKKDDLRDVLDLPSDYETMTPRQNILYHRSQLTLNTFGIQKVNILVENDLVLESES